MIKINLLPKEVQEKGKGIEWIILGVAFILIVVLGGSVQYFLKWKAYKKYFKIEGIWKEQLRLKEEEVQKVTQLDAEKALLEAKKNTVVQLHQGRLLYPQMMETFFSVLPQDVWVQNLSFKEDGGKIIVMANSNSLSINDIAEWLQTLESNPERFSSVSLSAIDAKESSYGFSMTFTYHPPPLKKS